MSKQILQKRGKKVLAKLIELAKEEIQKSPQRQKELEIIIDEIGHWIDSGNKHYNLLSHTISNEEDQVEELELIQKVILHNVIPEDELTLNSKEYWKEQPTVRLKMEEHYPNLIGKECAEKKAQLFGISVEEHIHHCMEIFAKKFKSN
jgi:hypothetical protein